MIKSEEVFKIGKFNKSHGIHGELSFTFTDDVFDCTDCEYLICLLDGIFVPFYIEEYRFRSDTAVLIKLQDVNSAERAREFANVPVYFPLKYAVEKQLDETFPDFFIGFEIEDSVCGNLGTVKEVDTSTINILFVIENSQGELLIPAREEFITRMDYKNRRIQMDLPEGLIDLSMAVTDTD